METVVIVIAICVTAITCMSLLCGVGISINYSHKDCTEHPAPIVQTLAPTTQSEPTDPKDKPPTIEDMIQAVNEMVGGINYE